MKYHKIPLTSKIGDIFVNMFIKKKNISKASKIVEELKSNGITPSNKIYNSFLNYYKEEKDLSNAEEVFKSLYEKSTPDKYSYNIMINLYCKLNDVENTEKYYEKMVKNGVVLELPTYNSLINLYSKHKEFEKAENIGNEMEKYGIEGDIITYTILIKSLCESSDVKKAIDIYEKLKQKKLSPNIITYTILLNYLFKSKQLNQVYSIMNDMNREKIQLSPITVSTIMKGLAKNSKSIEEIENFFSLLRDQNFPFTATNYNIMIQIYVDHNLPKKALKICHYMSFTQICTEYTINPILHYFLKKENHNAFESLISEKIYSIVTINLAIQLYFKVNQMDKIPFILSKMKNNKLRPDEYTFSILISGYLKNNKLKLAMNYFNEMKENQILPTSNLYTSLFKSFVKDKNFYFISQYYDDMKKNGIKPANHTFGTIIPFLFKHEKYNEIQLLSNDLIKYNIFPFENIFSPILRSLYYLKKFDCVIEFFDFFKENKNFKFIKFDIFIYNTVLLSYLQISDISKAIEFYNVIRNHQSYPTLHTFVLFINFLFQLEEIHSLDTIFNDFITCCSYSSIPINIFNDVIQLYCKKQFFDKAESIFYLFYNSNYEYFNIHSFTPLIKAFIDHNQSVKLNEILSIMNQLFISFNFLSLELVIAYYCKRNEFENAIKYFYHLSSCEKLSSEQIYALGNHFISSKYYWNKMKKLIKKKDLKL